MKLLKKPPNETHLQSRGAKWDFREALDLLMMYTMVPGASTVLPVLRRHAGNRGPNQSR